MSRRQPGCRRRAERRGRVETASLQATVLAGWHSKRPWNHKRKVVEKQRKGVKSKDRCRTIVMHPIFLDEGHRQHLHTQVIQSYRPAAASQQLLHSWMTHSMGHACTHTHLERRQGQRRVVWPNCSVPEGPVGLDAEGVHSATVSHHTVCNSSSNSKS